MRIEKFFRLRIHLFSFAFRLAARWYFLHLFSTAWACGGCARCAPCVQRLTVSHINFRRKWFFRIACFTLEVVVYFAAVKKQFQHLSFYSLLVFCWSISTIVIVCGWHSTFSMNSRYFNCFVWSWSAGGCCNYFGRLTFLLTMPPPCLSLCLFRTHFVVSIVQLSIHYSLENQLPLSVQPSSKAV